MNPPQRSSWVPGPKGDAMYAKAMAKYNAENEPVSESGTIDPSKSFYAQKGNPTVQVPTPSPQSTSQPQPSKPQDNLPYMSPGQQAYQTQPSQQSSGSYAQAGNPTMPQQTTQGSFQPPPSSVTQSSLPYQQGQATSQQGMEKTSTAFPGGTQGFDEQALLKSGISQAQIDQMKAIMGPAFQATQALKENAKAQNEFIQQDLKDEQKDVEALYSDIKKKKEELNQQSLSIVDQSAKVQQEISDQEYQKSKFANEQAQKQYELDTNRAERKQELVNDDNELRMRRAISAQLGASYGSMGLEIITKEKQRGEEILSDLRAQTAIGKSEFAFKAIDIEKSYSNALKEISVNSQSQKLSLIKNLQDDLDGIDEKILSSKEEKRQQARDAMKDYYDRLNDIETASANQVTVAVEKMFTEKKELDEEKKQKEAVNIEMSEALGYMANKYGEAIGINDGEPPVPFTGNFNEKLSQQFGYLVDAHGNAIMGSDRKRIPYADAEKQEFDSIMNMFGGMGINTMDGMAQFAQENPIQSQQLNGTFGRNPAILSAKPNGANGGWCGTYVRSQFTNESGGWPNTIAQKKAWIDSKGIPKKDWVPKVGDIIIQTVGKWGHFAMIGEIEITPDGKRMATLSESNWRGDEKVNNTRKIDLDDPKNAVYGAYRTQLKEPYASSMPKVAPDFGQSEGSSQNQKPFGFIVSQSESGGDYGRVSTGKGDAGGVSYGKYQFAGGSIQKFLNNSGYAGQFNGLKPGTPAFSQKWQQISQSDPAFNEAQDESIKKSHYYPLIGNLKKNNIDISDRGQAVQEIILSTGTQYGAGTNVVQKALQGKNVSAMSDEDIISTIQDYKMKTLGSYFKSSPTLHKGIANRIRREKQQALEYAGGSKALNQTDQPQGIPSMMTGGGMNLSNISPEGKKQLMEAVASGNPAKLKGALFALKTGLFNQGQEAMSEKEKLELEGLKYDVQSKKYKAENPEASSNPYDFQLKQLNLEKAQREADQDKKGKILNSSDLDKIQKIQGISGLLDQLELTMGNVNFDPFWGGVEEMNPWNENAKQFQNVKNLLTGPSARTLMQEVGALTESDLKRIEASVPSLKDTPEVANDKLRTLKSLVAKLQKNVISTYKKAGYDVSGFMDTGSTEAQSGASGYTFGGVASGSFGGSSDSYDEYF